MIQCRVCGEGNDELAITCRSCGGFLQRKVEALDLFATMWGLFENPGGTMRRIVLARRKNYVFFLSAAAGIFLVFAGFWTASAGERFDNVFPLMGAILLAGPAAGILAALVATLLLAGSVRLMGGKGRFKDFFAVASYAASPVVLAVALILPLTFALFGVYFFGSNPPPYVLDPPAFYVLTGLDALALIWAWILLVRGTAIAGHLPLWRAAIASVAVPAVVSGIVGLGLLMRVPHA